MTREALLCEKIKEKNLSSAEFSSNLQPTVITTPSEPKSVRLSLINEIDPIYTEVNRYFNMDANRELEALDWWRVNTNKFKNLILLAQIYFSIPASSASSEMAFSTAGNFISSKRSNIHPAKLNKLCVIHDNFELIKDKIYQNK